MSTLRRLTRLGLGLAVAGAMSSAAHGQVERSGGGELQKIMQQYQQVAAEKTALQAQLVQAKKDADDSKAELAVVKKERDAFKARAAAAVESAGVLAQSRTSKEAADKSLELYKQRMTELVSRFRETATNLKEVESDRGRVQMLLDERNTAFDHCAENNLQLYEITGQVLDRYEHVGLFTKASAEEPFTRITRTRIDNLVDEYRERALALRSKQRSPVQ